MAMPYPVKRKHSLLNASKHQKVEVMSDLTKRSYKWSYGVTQKKWVTGVITLLIKVITLLTNSGGPPCRVYET